jgi:hypothetical protein
MFIPPLNRVWISMKMKTGYVIIMDVSTDISLSPHKDKMIACPSTSASDENIMVPFPFT